VREIAKLGHAVDGMKASLRSFGRYVPTDLVRTLLAAGTEARLGGDIRRLSIFFSDVADFTSISEGLAPRPLVAAMGRYFALMTEAISRHHGTVDKFMGDGIMAFFNAPLDLPDHPRQACLAALAAQAALARAAAENRAGDPVFRTRIGLGLGDVLVGNIGTPERFAYTLLGDEVNLASRLEGLNKLYGTAIIASEEMAAAAGDGFEWRRLDRVAVKGRHQGTLVCELLGERGAVAAEIRTARNLYEAALAAYLTGDFIQAAAGFDATAAVRPNDLAAPMMAERSRALAADPPADWTGIHIMHEK
jgi:adenylate cyclase